MLCLAIVLTGVIWVLEKGPSPYITELFCRSTRETSALRWVPGIFLTEEEAESYKTEVTETVSTETVNTSLIHIAAGTGAAADGGETADDTPWLEIIDIAVGTAKGKLMIVHDPSLVTLGISGEFGVGRSGKTVTDICADYGAIAGVNAGGFNDEAGRGNGGSPQGLVIYRGELIWGEPETTYNVVGFDADHILHIGTMTGAEALEQGVTDGISFVTHDGQSSSLIINGVVQSQNIKSGVNPRTAIGQRADGSVLLLVLEGRSVNTFGASMEDIINIMLSYGAVNCGNLDGGSSSVMVYDGEIINNCVSVVGVRTIPTAFIVFPEEAAK